MIEFDKSVKDVFQSFGISDVSKILENETMMMLLSKESRYRAEYHQFKNKYYSIFPACFQISISTLHEHIC